MREPLDVCDSPQSQTLYPVAAPLLNFGVTMEKTWADIRDEFLEQFSTKTTVGSKLDRAAIHIFTAWLVNRFAVPARLEKIEGIDTVEQEFEPVI